MRGWVPLFLLLGTSIVACGGKRATAKDPSEANTNEPPKDEPPKWEGASAPEDPKPKSSSGGATVNEAPTKRTDQYDKEATEVVLKRAARQVQANCGASKDESGKSGPWGKATVQVQLGHNGRSKGITVPAPYQGKASGNCVEKAFTNLTFPPWSGADTTVDWEVDIVEPGKEPKK